MRSTLDRFTERIRRSCRPREFVYIVLFCFILTYTMNYEMKKSFDCNQGQVRSVRYNVDGNYCLTCGSDRKIKLWNPKNGLLIKVREFKISLSS
jgi:WD40 repeat protein